MTGQPRLHPSTNYFSENFVICAGSVLLRAAPDNSGWQICILHSQKDAVWVLPKGWKDCGESVEDAALCETYEETGYKCELFPRRMMTRAPLPHINVVDEPRIVEGAVEPFAMTMRGLGEAKGTKIIWWYLTKAINDIPFEGTQMETEDFRSQFIAAHTAIEWLTFQDDQEIASQALKLVLNM